MEPIGFLDMDGVLVDFHRGAVAHYGLAGKIDLSDMDWDLHVFERFGIPNCTEPGFWQSMGRDFWSGLGWTPEGKDLLRGAEKIFGPHNVCLLTTACGADGCKDGKADWVERHIPQYLDRMYTGKGKFHLAAPTKVLVDDYDGNVDRWNLAGGIGVRAPRPWNQRFPQTTKPDGGFNVYDLLDEIRDARREALLRSK